MRLVQHLPAAARRRVALSLILTLLAAPGSGANPAVAAEASKADLPKIRLTADGRGFTKAGARFSPLGVNYYRPGTGWAPQLWKQFDREAAAADMARMKELGVSCVRVFLTYGSFFWEQDQLSPEGLVKFDQFLELAERAGIYVHPTGPDHWEGLPAWAKGDRIADETVLSALEQFWRLLATRYRGRNVLFAYDLLNEPEVRWDTPALREKWNRWLKNTYVSEKRVAEAWSAPEKGAFSFGSFSAPEVKDSPDNQELLDYQHFREEIADDWTRRQVDAIKSADPEALVTVGLIQWSVPALLPRVSHYSGFRPQRQARFLDFLEVHFYPLNNGFYEYQGAEEEARNLAYLESVLREVAAPGKPVVLAEFGWYGGGKPTIDNGRHPAASEEQQARWCEAVVKTTAGLAVGWLNWGFYDQPEAGDVSQLTGLLTADGRLKAWGQVFKRLATDFPFAARSPRPTLAHRPALNWDRCLTSVAAGHQFREEYFRAFAE